LFSLQIIKTLTNANKIVHCGGASEAVAQRVESWTCDQQVMGSNATRAKAA